jgi:hypothetical protein
MYPDLFCVSGDEDVWMACLSLSQKWFLEESLAKKKSRWRVAPGFASRGFDPRPERDICGMGLRLEHDGIKYDMHTSPSLNYLIRVTMSIHNSP